MVVIRETGDWATGQVTVRWAESSRVIHPEVERAIESSWQAAAARLGDKLFDGPMCRLEYYQATPDQLALTLSRSNYKPFLGTNLHNAQLADRFGANVLVNPVGISAALETADGWLLLGRRNESVAYHPGRVHPFAGALEPHDPLDVFDEIHRELDEELSLAAADITALRCIGLVEDQQLRQPELIFHARSTLTRAAIEARLDATEHVATYPIRAIDSEIQRAIGDPVLTPVAVAALMLWSRLQS